MTKDRTSTADRSTRVVVITGASRGIGREVSCQAAERGWVVVLGARDLARGRAAADALAARGLHAQARQLDVTDGGSIGRLAHDLQQEFGAVDALVNNAAVDYDTWARASTADLDAVRRTLETNLFGAWQTTLALLPLLRASRSARIVNVSSEGGSLTNMGGGTPAYSLSKAGLNALTRMLAAELRSDRILVNSVCPGWVATDMGGAGGRPVSDGAAGVLWALELPDDGPTGGFFHDGRPLPW